MKLVAVLIAFVIVPGFLAGYCGSNRVRRIFQASIRHWQDA
jgi:hypothetical protein